MAEPLTEELLEELLSSPNPELFLDFNPAKNRTLPEYLNELLAEKGLKRAQVIRDANLNETFGYQIFKGQRGAQRNKLLQLSFAMGLDIRETDRLLKIGGTNELYCKNKRDAIIIFAVDKGYSLQKTNEELYRFGEETIC